MLVFDGSVGKKKGRFPILRMNLGSRLPENSLAEALPIKASDNMSRTVALKLYQCQNRASVDRRTC
jgi:hypothetical protein